jgi:hypothetical protein
VCGAARVSSIGFRLGESISLRDYVDSERAILHPSLVAKLPNGQWWMFLGHQGGQQQVSVLIGDELAVLRKRHPEYLHFPDSLSADGQIVWRSAPVWRKIPAKLIVRFALRAEVKRAFDLDCAVYFQGYRVVMGNLQFAPIEFTIGDATEPTLLLPYGISSDAREHLAHMINVCIRHIAKKEGRGVLSKQSRKRPHGLSFNLVPASVLEAGVAAGVLTLQRGSDGALVSCTDWEQLTQDGNISTQNYPSTVPFTLGGNRKLKFKPLAKRVRLMCDHEISDIITDENYSAPVNQPAMILPAYNTL